MIQRLLLTACLFLVVQGCSVYTPSASQEKTSTEKPVYYVYLAGPEVFLPDPIGAGEQKKARIKALNKEHNWPFKLVGLYPMDNEIPDFAPNQETGLRIYHANIALMDKADFVAANMIRFRGPSMDVGTAFEMGYMRGLGKGVYAYYEAEPFYGKAELPGTYAARVEKYYEVDGKHAEKDAYGQSIENFNMADNLMMIGALADSKTQLQNSFDQAIEAIAAEIMAGSK